MLFYPNRPVFGIIKLMQKFKKALVYEFEGSADLTELVKPFAEKVITKHANDDYKDLLTQENFKDVDCFITDIFDNFKNELFDLKTLKYVGTNFTDLAMFDVEFLEKNGVTVKNIKGQATEPVAEFMLSVLLNIIRKTDKALEYAKNGGHGFSDFKGTEIGSKNVAVYGLGGIGGRFADICHYFGASVSYTSRTTRSDYTQKELNELTEDVDVLVVTVPLTDETRGTITKEILEKLNEEAVILCPTRLDVLNTPELVQYLKENPKSTFWMDGNHGDAWEAHHKELLELDNFLVTPGNGFFTKENRPRAHNLTKTNIESYLSS